MQPGGVYENPLITRYAGRSMAERFGARRRTQVWRELWIALAEAQAELGLPIRPEQVAALKSGRDSIDLEAAARYEERFRHDVMAHIHAYGDVAPDARGILHLGATSCYVTDNADLLLMREALGEVIAGVVTVARRLAGFARAHRDLPTLGFTHFQAAQLTTVGKRATLWLQDLLLDLDELERRRDGLKLRGAKGTTGTQASFLALFDGDHAKVRDLDRKIAAKMGFADVYPVTGQTYTRKVDSQIVASLSGVCESAHKFATDLRLLAHRKEVEEPFEAEQVGSSAMAYKRNPMRAERICAIARYVMALPPALAQTEATQWLERTLDDSALRRLVLPQAFLGVDAVLRLYANVAGGLVVHPEVIRAGVDAELPFMATENVLMAAVRSGGDRQDLHERIRRHSRAAADVVKGQGKPNDLIERLRSDASFEKVDWTTVLDPAAYVGRAPQQVDEFLAEVAQPALDRHARVGDIDASVHV